MANLISRAPQPPDFHWCDSYYSSPFETSENILLSDCLIAEARMPRGSQPVRYYNWQAMDQSDHPETQGPFVGKHWENGWEHE